MADLRSERRGILLFITLHLICCVGALLALGVISVSWALAWQKLLAILPALAITGGVLAAGALYFYFLHGCRHCPTPLRKEKS